MAGDDDVQSPARRSAPPGPPDADDASTPASAAASASASASQPAAKKRRTGASSRGVANLTPEQLARKRANDREAQRAIRERTKNQIDALHRRIRELEGQQPYHDLQHVIRSRDAVQAELHDVRKRLESAVAILTPVLRPQPTGLNELAAAAERLPLNTPPLHNAHVYDPRTFNSTLGEIAASPQLNGLPPPPSAAIEATRSWAYTPTSHARRMSSDDSHISSGLPCDERLGVDFLLENNAQRPTLDPNLPSPSPPPQPSTTIGTRGLGQHAPLLVPHLTLPRNIASTCPLDAILLDFLADRQQRAAAGDPIKTLVGPLYPNFTPIKYPERNVVAHPLSKLFTDILRTFPDICGLPEQVAIVYIMFLIMRWQIEPSQENYDRLPDWVTPRASQLFVPHPAWHDHLPWPKLRDRLIVTQPPTPFDTFFVPFTTTVSLNWPYQPCDCLLPASSVHRPSALSSTSSMPASSPFSMAVNAGSPAGPPTPQPPSSTPGGGGPSLGGALPREDDEWLINPAFESHLRDLGNWSLGPAFRSVFPGLGDCVRIKEGR